MRAFYFKIVFFPSNTHLNLVSFQVEKFSISCSLVTEGENLLFEHTLLQETTREGWLGYSVTAVPRKHNSCWGWVYLQPLHRTAAYSLSHQIAHKSFL